MTRRFGGESEGGIRFALHPAAWLGLIVVFYAAAMLLFQPEWWLRGAMFAEMATTYYPSAQSPDWRVVLFATDAGYIPLPQRLIALATNLAAVRADIVPDVYSACALIAAPLLVGVFALPRFRPLVGCDLTRLLVAFVVLGAAEVSMRGFINFTYFAVFFGAVLGALALHPRGAPAPRWVWILPVLMLSKPYTLTLMPLFAIGVVVARGRWRAVLAVSILAFIVQAVQVVVSASAGVMGVMRPAPVPLSIKLQSLGLYLAGNIGSFLAGPLVWKPFLLNLMIGIGIVVLGVIGFVLLRARHGAALLLLAGLAVYAGTTAINVFALTVNWGLDPINLRGPILYRHNFTSFCGFVLVVAALSQILADRIRRLRGGGMTRQFAVATLFVLWWATSGWAGSTFNFTETPGFPTVGSSYWKQSALFIDQPAQPVCVPLDPFPWIYGRDCRSLAAVPGWTGIAVFGTEGNAAMQVPVPPEVAGAELRAFAVLLSPIVPGLAQYRLQARVTYGTGGTARFVANGQLRAGVSLAYFIGSFPVKNVKSIELVSDIPLGVLTNNAGGVAHPVTLWMGQ